MALSAKISKEVFDGLPDLIKAEYIQTDGNILLNVTPIEGFALENVEGLKNSLAATRTERDNATTLSKQFEGITADEAKTAILKVKEYASFDPEQKVAEGIKAQKEMIIAEHNKVVNSKDETINKLTGQVERHLIDSTATVALAEAKGNVTLLMPHIKDQVKMKEIDGNYVAQILDKNGNARIGDTQGNLMTMGQLVTEMKGNKEYASAFEGTGNSGTSTEPGGSTDTTTATTLDKGETKVINSSDQDGLNTSLADLASGKTTVQFNG